MSYTIPFTDTAIHPTPITVEDQTLNTADTSLTFVGKNYPGYSQAIGSNFVHMLENFASAFAPSNPIQGQLWYDTGTSFSPTRPQLKIYDGTKWTESGNVKKGTVQPSAVNSVIGDLWVDISAQQLYLFTGATWVLVGPQFSDGSLSGLTAEAVIDRDTNTEKTILIFYTSGVPVSIISKDAFTPKVAIAGFETIRQGVNLSDADFDLDGQILNKFWGTSEKANALVVGNNTVAAANFLRSDTVSTTNYTINIRNGSGLVIGDSLQTSLTTSASGAILNHKTPGSPLVFKTTTTGGISNDVITVTGNQRVGINKNPTEALDVTGNLLIDGTIKTTNDTASSSTTTGALQVSGGAGIAGAINVGGNSSILGHLTVGGATSGVAVNPRLNESHDLGATGNRFRAIYSKDFVGQTFTGSFVGSLSGDITGAASRLSTVSAFSMRGDITSNVIPFNGSEPVPVRAIAFVARNVLGTATVTTSVNHGYVSGYIVEVSCSNTSFDTLTGGQIITVTGLTTFTYDNIGSTVTTTAATGTVTTRPGGSFYTVLSDGVIADKTELSNTIDSDFFLVYRSTATPSLRKISKSTLFSTAGTVPTASIMPYAGDVPPAGYLFCDGSEQSQSAYPELFTVLGYKYKAAGLLIGFQTFALPDLRGRFALGRDNMDNASSISVQISATGAVRTAIAALGAITTTFVIQNSLTTNGPFQAGKTLTGTGLDISSGPVTITTVSNNTPSAGYTTLTVSMPSQPTTYPALGGLILVSIGTIDGGGGTANRVPSATIIGNVSGQNQRTITTSQMPAHGHLFDDIRWSEVDGSYTYNDPQLGVISVGPAAGSNRGTDYDNGAHFTQHGTYNTGGGLPVDIMNPYQTINYIIFTGRIL